ncbi:MAG TPA: exo-alpha-sialidase [Ignavibacteria bacterium]
MKKIILLFLIFIIHYSLFINHCKSQWSDDIRLTNAPDTSIANNSHAKLIASNGNMVHTVWWDKRDGNREIYYKRSTNGGVSWEQDTRLTNNTAWSWYPSIAVSGLNVHVVWMDFRDGFQELYYKRSTDEGITWGTDTRLTIHTTGFAASPSIAVSGQDIHVFWHDSRDGGYAEIYYKKSTDAGMTWSADMRLTNDPAFSFFPSCAVIGSLLHVAWCDARNGYYQVFYKRSTDGGVNWKVDTSLTNTISNSYFNLHLSAEGSFTHVVWHDNRDGNYEIYYKRTTDGGMTWGADTRLTNNPASSMYPSVVVSGSNVHIAWRDDRDGNNEVYYKLSTNGGVTWGADTRLTYDPSISERPSISISNSVLHIVWSDYRDGNYEIYYKCNPTGNLTEIKNISSQIPSEFKLEQNYPNPFNPTTKIKFSFPSDIKHEMSNVKLVIYDITGKEVAILVNEQLQPGTYEVTFDGSNYSSGIYFYKLSTTEFTDTKRLVLLK